MPEETILVVDDEPSLRRSLEKMLLRAGYVVHTASNPQEARCILQANEIDLAILDIVMPNWTGELSQTAGIDLLEEVKKQYPETKMIMLTAYATVETAVKALKIGALDYIIKANISSRSFLAMIAEALGSNASGSSQQRSRAQAHHADSFAQPRTFGEWLKERLSDIADEVIASLFLSVIVFMFGKVIGILEGGLASWFSNPRSVWYLTVGFVLVIVLVAAYTYGQRRA